MRLFVALVVGFLGCGAGLLAAEPPLSAPFAIRQLPRTVTELSAAHERARDRSCLPLVAGQLLEIADFSERVATRVSLLEGGQRVRKVVSHEACRLTGLTIASTLTPQDVEQLPLISGDAIRQRLQDNYIAIQARVLRDKSGDAPYLHYRPIGAAAAFQTPGKTQALALVMSNTLRDVRALGLLVDQPGPITAESLRTLVVLNKIDVAAPEQENNAAPEVRPVYEWLFLRARVRASGGNPPEVSVHGFATTEERGRLHYFGVHAPPSSPDGCDILGTICFTEYDFAGIQPTARATRCAKIHGQSSFSLAELDRFVVEQKLPGQAFDHLNLVLDAIIDGRLSSRPMPTASP